MKNMYKIVVLSLIFVFLLSMPLLAVTTITGSTTIGGSPFSPSAKVTVNVTTDSAGTQYGASSAHVNGSFEYGTCGGRNLDTACDPSKVYKNPYSKSDDPATPTTPTSNGSFVSGWSH